MGLLSHGELPRLVVGVVVMAIAMEVMIEVVVIAWSSSSKDVKMGSYLGLLKGYSRSGDKVEYLQTLIISY
ncbi:hypothetical protein CFP56_021871 [Quercus suber]|uniref:Uncharacterized protein n=1 Tax=Quercus suber TaxID=58331 RepID=A0AAW0KC89_QUESU